MPPVAGQQGLLERPASRIAELLVEVRDGGKTIAQHQVVSNALIGRAAEAQIHLDRGTVSRQHAEVLCDPFGRWWIRDLKSRNGVVYAGRRVDERAIRNGDVFQVGDFSLRFRLPDADETDTTRDKGGDHTTFVPVSDQDAAIDISTARELGSPKVAAEHLSMLLETGRQLMEIEESESRLTHLLQLMLRPEFKGTCAMALRAQSGRLESPVALVPTQTVTGHGGNRVPVSRSLLKSALERKSPVMAGNAGGGSVHGDMVEMSIISSVRPMCAVACPLRLPGTDGLPDGAIDLLYVVFPPECATGEWLAIAALATEQYRLSESAWVARRDALDHAAVERDLEQARQIQMQFLPKGLSVPGLEVAVGFQPCRWVAGDYTDAMLLADGRIFLAVADVCGKGLAAALVASSIHTLVRAMLDDGDSLDRVMNRLNRHFVRYLTDGRFATMACAIVEPDSGTVQYANCGHPPVFIVGRGGKARDLPTGSNLPLGVDSETIVLSEDRLESGDLLAMYTDGLNEARTVTGEMLGIERVREQFCTVREACEAFPVAEACKQMVAWMDSISGGRLQDDDRTYLLARRR